MSRRIGVLDQLLSGGKDSGGGDALLSRRLEHLLETGPGILPFWSGKIQERRSFGTSDVPDSVSLRGPGRHLDERCGFRSGAALFGPDPVGERSGELVEVSDDGVDRVVLDGSVEVILDCGDHIVDVVVGHVELATVIREGQELVSGAVANCSSHSSPHILARISFSSLTSIGQGVRSS